MFEHSKVERMAAVDEVPIVNLLSDDGHPMQALADLLTMQAHLGALDGPLGGLRRRRQQRGPVAGPGRRHARHGGAHRHASWLRACGRATSTGSGWQASSPVIAANAREAVAGADVVYTDVWTSMGQEAEAELRRRAFEGFTVDDELLAAAAPEAVFLHCLPAHRGEEVAGSVADGPRSLIWPQAENRMHAARGLLAWILEQLREPIASPSWASRSASTSSPSSSSTGPCRTRRSSSSCWPRKAASPPRPPCRATSTTSVPSRCGSPEARAPTPSPSCPTEQVAPEDHLRRVFGDWVVEVAHSGNLVVLRTPPGSAHVVGSALDRAGLPDILGTVAGDDTLIVVVSEDAGGAAVADEMTDLAGL